MAPGRVDPTGWSSPLWESNPRHQPYHGCALPTELRGRFGARQSRGPTRECIGAATFHAPRRPRAVEAPAHGLRSDRVRWRRVSTGARRSRIRLATVDDAEAIATIYNHEVTHATATFDLVPRTLDEQQAVAGRRARGAFAAIVAVDGDDDGVVGLRLAVAVQGARRLPHHRRGLGLRRTATTPGGASARLLLAELVDVAATSGSTP